uniref:Uncharacterized protein n=1 Tax=Daucus carota subsp. sativus TaxID=79200 RepID=A0A161WX57_DAUCS
MMDKYGLKRPPLSPLSPSSIQRGQRRRIPANESSDGYGSRVCKENQHPNLTAQKSTPGDSVLTVENEYNFVREGCLSHGKVMHVRAVTHRTPLARLIEMQSSKQTRTGRFQLPASNILPRSVHDPKASAQHLRNHVHQSIRNDASRTISLIHNHSIDSTSKGKAHNGVDSRSQSGKDDDVTVIVPEPGQLGVKTPEWFQSDSQRGVRNLMESFNSACTTEAGTSATRGAPPMTGNNSSQTEEGGTSARLDENFDGAEGDEAVQDEGPGPTTFPVYLKLQNQTSTEFPEEIRAITGKELRLKLLISEDNVKVNSRLFFAVDAVDADAPVSAICSVSGTSSTTSSITNSSAVKHLEETETPSTSISSTKRVKVVGFFLMPNIHSFITCMYLCLKPNRIPTLCKIAGTVSSTAANKRWIHLLRPTLCMRSSPLDPPISLLLSSFYYYSLLNGYC